MPWIAIVSADSSESFSAFVAADRSHSAKTIAFQWFVFDFVAALAVTLAFLVAVLVLLLALEPLLLLLLPISLSLTVMAASSPATVALRQAKWSGVSPRSASRYSKKRAEEEEGADEPQT